MTTTNEDKELTLVRTQATKAMAVATDIQITDEASMTEATDVLSKMKTVAKMIKERKEAITKPMLEAINSARDLFKPIENTLATAELTIKKKMLDYSNEQEKARQEAMAKVAARVEKGTMKPATALKKMEAMPEVATSTQGKVGAVAFRTVKKFRVVDEIKLPREYMIPDMAKITAALKAGIAVPGAEVYEEKQVASSSQLKADHPLLGQK